MTARPMEINQDIVLAHLEKVKSDADGDLARMLELLLLENEILRQQSSSGFLRGSNVDLTAYPRFLSVIDESDDLMDQHKQV